VKIQPSKAFKSVESHCMGPFHWPEYIKYRPNVISSSLSYSESRQDENPSFKPPDKHRLQAFVDQPNAFFSIFNCHRHLLQ